MAAAVQTNLSVAFTHGAQLTMDLCEGLNPWCSYPLASFAEGAGESSLLVSL